MNSGTVKFFNDQRGFGFIRPDNGDKDVFVHATALERAGINGLREGQKVNFDTRNDPRTDKIAVDTIEIAKTAANTTGPAYPAARPTTAGQSRRATGLRLCQGNSVAVATAFGRTQCRTRSSRLSASRSRLGSRSGI